MKTAVLAPKGEGLKLLTFRERKFVDKYFETNFNGAEAARLAGYSKKAAKVQAARLLTKANLLLALEVRKKEHQEKITITREEWMRKVRCLFDADVRKLFDAHNNPIDIPLLGDNEAMLIEGFEVVEDFTKVKNNKDGKEQAVCTGYTKKIRYTKPKDVVEFVGKVMGYITDEAPDPEDPSLKSLTVVFVNSKGERVDVNLNPPPKPPRVIDQQPALPIGVTFVR